MRKNIKTIVILLIAVMVLCSCSKNEGAGEKNISKTEDNKAQNGGLEEYDFSYLNMVIGAGWNYAKENDISLPAFRERRKVCDFLRLDNLDTIVENLEYIEGQYEGSLLSRKYYYKKTLDYSSLLYYGEIDSKGRPDGIGVIVELQDGYYYGDEPCLSIQYAGCFKNGMYDGYGLSFDVKKMEDIPYSVSYETLINNYFLFNGMVTHEGYFKEGRYDGKGVDYVSGLYALLAGVEDESYEVNPLELEYSIDVGKYKDGKPKGNVKRYFRDVLYYDGEMDREGNYHGKGKLYDDVTGKLIYDGEFSRGEYHGKGTLYDENGKVIHKGKFKFGDIK